MAQMASISRNRAATAFRKIFIRSSGGGSWREYMPGRARGTVPARRSPMVASFYNQGDRPMRQLFLPALLCLLLVPAVARADDEKDTMQRMAQEHQHDKPSASPAAMEQPAQPVDAEEGTYGEAGGKPLPG